MALKQKLILLAFILAICTSHVLASTSTSFQINDESLDFASNAGFLESATYAMDLGGITWIDRNSESGSYILIDGNSILEEVDPVIPPLPPSSGGGGGGSALILPDDDEEPVMDEIVIVEEVHEAAPEEIAEEEVAEEEVVEEEVVEEEVVEEEVVEELISYVEPSEEPIVEEESIAEQEPTFIFTEEEGFLYYETTDGLDEYDFVTELDYEVEQIEIVIPAEDQLESHDGEIIIDGNTGSNYEITAIWIGEDYVARSTVTADENGKFMVKTPGTLKDGEYMVLLYGLEINENKIVQTKYTTVKFNVIDGKAYVKDIKGDVKLSCVRWDFIALYVIIILITIYTLWRKIRK